MAGFFVWPCKAMARSRRKTGTLDSDYAQNLWNLKGLAQKGSPAKPTGRTLRVAAQYIQKTAKNNGLSVIWLAVFRPPPRSIVLLRVGIDPSQDFLEMGLDGLVAETGAKEMGI